DRRADEPSRKACVRGDLEVLDGGPPRGAAGRRPELALRSCVRSGACRIKLVPQLLYKRVWVMLDLEVPQPHNAPTRFDERLVLTLIASHVALDLLVPVAAPAPRLPFAWVAVPEGAVDEHRDFPARERHVDTTARTWPMTPEAAEAGPPQRRTKQALGSCVPAADARHDSPAAVRRSGRRAERV